MSLSFASKFSLVLLSGLATAAIGCSAKASDPDAGGAADARRTTPRPDAEPFNFADAMPQLDAAPSCPDSNEPNNTSAAAKSLSADPVSSDDTDGTGSFVGAAQDADEDWYTYEGSDDIDGAPDPGVGFTSGNVEVCIFMDCLTGTEEYECPAPTVATDVGDLSGCCGTADFAVGIDCLGTISDDANVYIRVKASNAGVCEAYSLTYHY